MAVRAKDLAALAKKHAPAKPAAKVADDVGREWTAEETDAVVDAMKNAGLKPGTFAVAHTPMRAGDLFGTAPKPVLFPGQHDPANRPPGWRHARARARQEARDAERRRKAGERLTDDIIISGAN